MYAMKRPRGHTSERNVGCKRFLVNACAETIRSVGALPWHPCPCHDADCSPRKMPHEPRSGRDDDVRPTVADPLKSSRKPPRSVLVALFGALVPLLAALTLMAPPATARTEAVPA